MPSKRDYYEILGISRNTDPSVVKKAYRKKALELHPDQYKGDKKVGEEKFKELNEAYTVISDPSQRQIYDKFGHEGLDPARSRARDVDPVSIFNQIFNFGFDDLFGMGRRQPQRRGPSRGSDAVLELSISYEEAFEGIAKKVKLPYKRPCRTCMGSRAEKGSSMQGCNKCRGTGVVEQRVQQGMFIQISSTSCNRCGGAGETPQKPCKDCRGTGLSNKRETISVKIPPGIDDGELVRVQGKGYPSDDGGMPGDLIFKTTLKNHSIFERNGLDVYMEFEIPFHLAILGGELEAPIISGKKSVKTQLLKIPNGTQVNDFLKVKNKGYTRPAKGGRGVSGDMYYKINIKIPRKLNRKQKKALTEYVEASA